MKKVLHSPKPAQALPHPQRLGGSTIMLFAVLYMTSFVLASPFVGLGDGDNAADGLRFLNDHGGLFALSGIAAVVAALALVVAVLSVAELLEQARPNVMLKSVTTVGHFAAVFFFAHGVLRLNTVDTVTFMESLNPVWGESAYLAVQMAGTQGFAGSGVVALSLWAIGISWIGWRRKIMPHLLVLLGFIPTLPWVMAFFGRIGILPDGLWIVYISAILLGIPLWCIAFGIFLLRQRVGYSGGT